MVNKITVRKGLMKMHDQMEISLQINDGRLMGGESSVRDLLDH